MHRLLSPGNRIHSRAASRHHLPHTMLRCWKSGGRTRCRLQSILPGRRDKGHPPSCHCSGGGKPQLLQTKVSSSAQSRQRGCSPTKYTSSRWISAPQHTQANVSHRGGWSSQLSSFRLVIMTVSADAAKVTSASATFLEMRKSLAQVYGTYSPCKIEPCRR